jgi:hypothetical protein
VKEDDGPCPFCGARVARKESPALSAPRASDRRMPRSALMAAGAVGAVLAGTDCGGTVQQPALHDAAADAPSMQDASEASTSPVDASEASTPPVDANAGVDASSDVTQDVDWGVALYGGPPPLPDGSGPVDPDSGMGG